MKVLNAKSKLLATALACTIALGALPAEARNRGGGTSFFFGLGLGFVGANIISDMTYRDRHAMGRFEYRDYHGGDYAWEGERYAGHYAVEGRYIHRNSRMNCQRVIHTIKDRRTGRVISRSRAKMMCFNGSRNRWVDYNDDLRFLQPTGNRVVRDQYGYELAAPVRVDGNYGDNGYDDLGQRGYDPRLEEQDDMSNFGRRALTDEDDTAFLTQGNRQSGNQQQQRQNQTFENRLDDGRASQADEAYLLQGSRKSVAKKETTQTRVTEAPARTKTVAKTEPSAVDSRIANGGTDAQADQKPNVIVDQGQEVADKTFNKVANQGVNENSKKYSKPAPAVEQPQIAQADVQAEADAAKILVVGSKTFDTLMGWLKNAEGATDAEKDARRMEILRHFLTSMSQQAADKGGKMYLSKDQSLSALKTIKSKQVRQEGVKLLEDNTRVFGQKRKTA